MVNLNIPEVSVVIPTYNYAHFLRKCLESLRAQTFSNWEAIVVNNFSVDETVSVVESFGDNRIRLVDFKNNGVIAASRNKGIELAASGWIAFLDSDDIWYPEKLQRCLEGINSGADLVCHGMRYMVNGDRWKDVCCNPRAGLDFFNVLYNQSGISTSATVVRKQCLLEVGGFDESFDIVTAEDYALWLKLSKESIRARFIKDILGEYNYHGYSSSRRLLPHLQASLTVVNKCFSGKKLSFAYAFRIRRAKALLLYGTARGFQREGRKFMALWFFGKSLMAFPFLAKPYAGLALIFLPRRCSDLITRDFPFKAADKT